MPPVLALLLVLHLHVVGLSAATDTVSPVHPLVGNDRLVSGNGKFALGFFQLQASSSKRLLIAPVWVANRDDPLTEPNPWRLAISGDGNLVIASLTVNSTVWSTRANTKATDTVAVLLNNGNFVLRKASNSSNVLWQSFDHPTDTVISGGKIGRNKITGLNRRLVSRKNLISQATGEYYGGLDADSHQLVIAPLKKPSTPYWYSGEWNGNYFSLLPEMRSSSMLNSTYVNDEEEEYYMFAVLDETVILRHVLDVSGQAKTLIWNSDSQDWMDDYSKPNAPCDVFATCGAFTNCDDYALASCSCMKGFSIRSPEDWELADRTGGCIRKTPLDCRTGTTNKITGASLGVLGFSALILMLVLLVRSKMVWSGRRLNNTKTGGATITAFRYVDLQSATKNFSEKIGGGSFGSVFRGVLANSTTIAVKRLDSARQGEKQFRAEVSSVGTIQHINLVKLIGFCCERGKRLLVHEYMPNGSLDVHLFRSNNAIILGWSVRYQISLGIARGLAYLHESCRDCIIHCDIKPENILLDESFVPKIADFGLAKFLGRDFSRVLTTMRGTIGYLAPEWISGTEITSKVDVYSYGMVLFEIISGRRNSTEECTGGANDLVYFPVQVARKLVEGDLGSLVDRRLHDDIDCHQVVRACKVACWCVQDNESDRPTMAEVVQALEGLAELKMPPMPRLLHAIAGGSQSTNF
ncbi:hypothetical protein EJB05_52774, partial [Eragrostis curvula]